MSSCKSGFPERGINETHCFLDLSAPDDQYIGGLLTTNSITSLKDVGLETDPPGYTQASIATIRVWKKRSPPDHVVRLAQDAYIFGYPLVIVGALEEVWLTQHGLNQLDHFREFPDYTSRYGPHPNADTPYSLS